MALTHLRHPLHGEKVACGDIEARIDKGNGWVEFDPATEVRVKPAPVDVVPCASCETLKAEIEELKTKIESLTPKPFRKPEVNEAKIEDHDPEEPKVEETKPKTPKMIKAEEAAFKKSLGITA